MTPETCARCGQPVATFAVWFSETCPQEAGCARDWGHRLSSLQLMRLMASAHPEHTEVIA